jgi:hypothetical protein
MLIAIAGSTCTRLRELVEEKLAEKECKYAQEKRETHQLIESKQADVQRREELQR